MVKSTDFSLQKTWAHTTCASACNTELYGDLSDLIFSFLWSYSLVSRRILSPRNPGDFCEDQMKQYTRKHLEDSVRWVSAAGCYSEELADPQGAFVAPWKGLPRLQDGSLGLLSRNRFKPRGLVLSRGSGFCSSGIPVVPEASLTSHTPKQALGWRDS